MKSKLIEIAKCRDRGVGEGGGWRAEAVSPGRVEEGPAAVSVRCRQKPRSCAVFVV